MELFDDFEDNIKDRNSTNIMAEYLGYDQLRDIYLKLGETDTQTKRIIKQNMNRIETDFLRLFNQNFVGRDLRPYVSLLKHHLYTANGDRVSLKDVNLEGADLTGFNLSNIDLSGANLRKAEFKDTRLKNTNFNNADLEKAKLKNKKLSQASFKKANLTQADLENSDLSNTTLKKANLFEAKLRGANLRGANLRGADLRSADLRGADLRGADLTRANLLGSVGTNLRDAILDQTIMPMPDPIRMPARRAFQEDDNTDQVTVKKCKFILIVIIMFIAMFQQIFQHSSIQTQNLIKDTVQDTLDVTGLFFDLSMVLTHEVSTLITEPSIIDMVDTMLGSKYEPTVDEAVKNFYEKTNRAQEYRKNRDGVLKIKDTNH